MIEIQVQYQNGLHCLATHMPSGQTLSTDAPLDNNGRGETFSPTDLVATAFASCIATVIGIVAERKSIPLDGMAVTIRKTMSETSPRRISRLELELNMPLAANHPERHLLESAARSCPVHHSLHPEIEIIQHWHWQP